MNNLSDAKSSELLAAQAHIWNYTFNFITSMSLKCAVELGIPDTIHSHGKPISISELSSALSIHPTKTCYIPRLMRILVHSGFLALAKTSQNRDEKEEEYVLTRTSHLLLKDNPFSISMFMLAELDPILTESWHFLSQWFRNEDPTAFSTCHGVSIWDSISHDPCFNTTFNKGMASDVQLVASLLIHQGKEVFDGLNSVVDVGGGTGTLAKSIAEAFPNIQCIVLDLPHVVAGLNDTSNLKYFAGNMFDSIPSADAVFLKWVLHNWKDEECLKILENCRKAIAEKKGGKVIIIDMVVMEESEKEEDIKTQLKFDMLMMMVLTGKERNEKEWAKLFSDAGFSGYKIIPVMGLRSIIEVYP